MIHVFEICVSDKLKTVKKAIMSFSHQPRGILKQSQPDHSRVSHMGDNFTQRSVPGDPPSQSASTQSAAMTNKISKGPSMRVLSGGVARVKDWSHYLHKLQSASSGSLAPVMFRVYGTVTSISPGPRSNKMVSTKILVITDLRDMTQSLRCVFHEIDRSLGPIKIGSHVAVTGRRITDKGEMQIFSCDTFTKEEVEPYLARMENFAIRSLKSIN